MSIWLGDAGDANIHWRQEIEPRTNCAPDQTAPAVILEARRQRGEWIVPDDPVDAVEPGVARRLTGAGPRFDADTSGDGRAAIAWVENEDTVVIAARRRGGHWISPTDCRNRVFVPDAEARAVIANPGGSIHLLVTTRDAVYEFESQ